MEFDTDILYPFLQELIAGYCKKILEQDEAKKLAEERRKLSVRVHEEFHGPHSEEYKLVADFIGCIYDLGSIQQEQLYIQGVKDGIRLRKLIREIEEGESC